MPSKSLSSAVKPTPVGAPPAITPASKLSSKPSLLLSTKVALGPLPEGAI
jgi:hypothetical protein